MEKIPIVSVDFPNIAPDLLTVGIVVVDRRFNVVLWNRFMELNSNFRSEEVLSKNLFNIFPEINRGWLERKIRSCIVLKMTSFSSWQQRPYLFRFRASPALSGEAEFMYQDISIFPVYDDCRLVQGACIVIHDTTELAETIGLLDRTTDNALAIEELNQRDGLTGLYNRKFFDELITQEILSARRYKRPLTVAMIDVDKFKLINDTHGHAAGDAVLRNLASKMKSMLRVSDTICRYGGEEFVLIFPNITLENSKALLERLRGAIEILEIDISDEIKIRVTVSVGLATLQDGVTAGQLVNRADESLYSSKHAGRNRTTCYEGPVTLSESAASLGSLSI